MRVEGTGGAAVTRANDPAFQMFATKSGRDIHDDLERAHRPVTSPIKLAPLTPAEEAALYSEDRPARRKLIPPARDRGPRKPATPARLPAPDPGPRPGATPGPSVPPQAQVGRGQTSSQRYRTRPRRFDHDAILAAYVTGMTRAQVARQVGCTGQTVTNVLRAAGVTTRNTLATAPPLVLTAPLPEPVLEPPAQDVALTITDLTNDLDVSLRTTVRRMCQAGFSASEIAIYAGVIEEQVTDVLMAIVREQAAI